MRRDGWTEEGEPQKNGAGRSDGHAWVDVEADPPGGVSESLMVPDTDPDENEFDELDKRIGWPRILAWALVVLTLLAIGSAIYLVQGTQVRL